MAGVWTHARVSGSAEFKREPKGVVDGPEFIETHATNNDSTFMRARDSVCICSRCRR